MIVVGNTIRIIVTEITVILVIGVPTAVVGTMGSIIAEKGSAKRKAITSIDNMIEVLRKGGIKYSSQCETIAICMAREFLFKFFPN